MSEDKKYLIVCLRYKNMLGADFLLFWGKDRSGYVTNVYDAGVYSQKDVDEICDDDDIPMPFDYLGIDPNSKPNTHLDLWHVVIRNQTTNKFIKQQVLKQKLIARKKRREREGNAK